MKLPAKVQNELMAFIESTCIKDFNRSLRNLMLTYLVSQIGREADNVQLITGLERIFNLLDSIEDQVKQ